VENTTKREIQNRDRENAQVFNVSKIYLAFPSHPWINHPNRHQVFEYIDTFTETPHLTKFQLKYLKSSGNSWR